MFELFCLYSMLVIWLQHAPSVMNQLGRSFICWILLSWVEIVSMCEEILPVLSLAVNVTFDNNRQPGTVAGGPWERHSSPAGLGTRILSATVTNAMLLCCLQEYRFSRPWQWREEHLSDLRCLRPLALMAVSAMIVANIRGSVAAFFTALALLILHGFSCAITIPMAPSQQWLSTQLHCCHSCAS